LAVKNGRPCDAREDLLIQRRSRRGNAYGNVQRRIGLGLTLEHAARWRDIGVVAPDCDADVPLARDLVIRGVEP
jgi:hypothetical protein